MILDWHTGLGGFSSVVLIALLYPYIYTILHGHTRPNVVSFAGWALLGAIATAVQFAEGASWSVMIPLLGTLSTATIAVLAIRLGYARFTKVEYVCIGLGALALILWGVTREPLFSLFLIMLADLFVTLPMVIKTYKHPDTEPAWLWLLYGTAASVGIIASTEYDIYNLLYPVYVTLGAFFIGLLALRRNVKKYRA